MINKTFITAGKAKFTLEVPAYFQTQHNTKSHYTYEVRRKEASDKWPEAYFVSLLSGPNNETDYRYLGMLNPSTGYVKLTKKSCCGKDAMAYRLLDRALLNIWNGQSERVEAAGFKLHHEGYCGRCGRTLTVPESIESGIGPECAKHLS